MVPAVTQIRVSDDYSPGNDQWVVVDATILAHAMGLAAFKDVREKNTMYTNSTCQMPAKCTKSKPGRKGGAYLGRWSLLKKGRGLVGEVEPFEEGEGA